MAAPRPVSIQHVHVAAVEGGEEAILPEVTSRMSTEFQSKIIQKKRLLPGIHGLRGIAATAVVFYHLVHLSKLGPPALFDFIGRDFGYSVHLFFVVSAFSLYYSTNSKIERAQWVPGYFARRLFRIAPLFYLLVAFQLFRQLWFGGAISTSTNDILLNLTFAFGFVPFTGIVWGGWSVGVEMIFYVVFPVLILTIRSHRTALLFLVATLLISYAVRYGLHLQHVAGVAKTKWNWAYFAFASNLCFFAMGIYAYQVSRFYADLSWQRKAIPAFALVALASLMFLGLGKSLYGPGRLDIMLWGFAFAALCVWQSISPSRVIANRFFEYLGERSFSIYLLHPVVIHFSKVQLLAIYQWLQPYLGGYAYFVCAVLAIALVLVFAEATYRLVEVPGIRLGQKLIRKRQYA